jgi:hypothetical protein
LTLGPKRSALPFSKSALLNAASSGSQLYEKEGIAKVSRLNSPLNLLGDKGTRPRQAKAETAHLYLELMALYLTQQAALAPGQTVYAFKRDLFLQPIPSQLPFSDYFSVAALYK